MTLAGTLARVLALAVLAAAALIAQARAHGWYEHLYDPVTHIKCCDATDCFPYPEEDVRRVANGWLLRTTGEVIEDRRVMPNEDHDRSSIYFRCGSATRTWCFFVKPTF